MKKALLSACLLFAFCRGAAQDKNDTIYFMNGEVLIGKVVDTLMNQVKCTYKGRKEDKELTLDEERIFSIRYGNGTEKVYYKYDTLVGNIFTVEEAWYFVLGEQDALRDYNPRFCFWSGIVVGAAGPIFTPTLIAPLPVFAYTGAVKIPKIRINTADIPDKERLKHDTYLLGYERVARKKKTFKTLAGGAVGLAIGFGAYFAFLQDEKP